MTKLEKIAEIIREYENGADASISAEDVLDCISAVVDSDDHIYDEEIKVETDAGTLIAYKGYDPDNPSVGIMLAPKGDTCQIDLAYAEVKGEELLEIEASEEEEGDVSLYIYGNVYSEDYSKKVIIKRSDVVHVLNI